MPMRVVANFKIIIILFTSHFKLHFFVVVQEGHVKVIQSPKKSLFIALFERTMTLKSFRGELNSFL